MDEIEGAVLSLLQQGFVELKIVKLHKGSFTNDITLKGGGGAFLESHPMRSKRSLILHLKIETNISRISYQEIHH